MGKLRPLIIVILLFISIGLIGIFICFKSVRILDKNASLQLSAGRQIKQSKTSNRDDSQLNLAILADIHSDWEELEKAISQINQNNKINIVLVLGDLTNLGSLEDLEKAKEMLAGLKPPVYVLPGNHDIWYSRRIGEPADANFSQVFPFQFRPACLSRDNLNLVFLDNSEENQEISQTVWQEAENCLSKSEKIIFFSHEPLYHPVNDLVMGKYSPGVATQAAILRSQLCDRRAKLVVSAHLHSFSQYSYSCPDFYQLPMIAAPALTRERNFQSPRFLELTIFADGRFEEKEIALE